MTIPERRMDRRTWRTRQAIERAFREVVQEKGFTAASIREISERADVNRGTFYLHFADKYTLATALHQQGCQTELIERSPTWQAIGAGIAVQPNGMPILHALGVGTAVEQAGAVIRHWDFCDQHGAVLSETDLEAL